MKLYQLERELRFPSTGHVQDRMNIIENPIAYLIFDLKMSGRK